MLRRAGVFFFVLMLLEGGPARAEPMREFLMSCTYGVLAGTLVGVATLAFEKRPSDHLKNIARGASYGLYAGMILGLYVVYLIPDEIQEEQIPGEPGGEGAGETPAEGAKFTPPAILPLITERGIEGVYLEATVLRF